MHVCVCVCMFTWVGGRTRHGHFLNVLLNYSPTGFCLWIAELIAFSFHLKIIILLHYSGFSAWDEIWNTHKPSCPSLMLAEQATAFSTWYLLDITLFFILWCCWIHCLAFFYRFILRLLHSCVLNRFKLYCLWHLLFLHANLLYLHIGLVSMIKMVYFQIASYGTCYFYK